MKLSNVRSVSAGTADALPRFAVAGISTATGELRLPIAPSSGTRRQGRYVLGDLLGRGGMAEVFSGFVMGSHGFQKPVAIKRLLPELANDDVFVERLIGEAKLLVGMQHGNIVSVLDLARDGDDVFLVMEYVDGPSLRQLMKARGPRLLPLGVASYIVQSAAAGLEFAHVRPGGAIIHADISPSNLLLTTSGEVRVADFGIARREGGLVGVIEGKWAYMAPEQARGESLTPRSDVFALGVVLYELITGQHPLGRQVSAEARDSGPIRVNPPRVVNPAVPPSLDAICMRALAEDARDRYPSMQSMIDSIMDERFSNQWREGASDLAHAIRETVPGASAAAPGPRTQVTDRPVTIVTRSLLSQPQRVSSQLEYESSSRSVPTDPREVGDSTRVITGPRGSAPLIPPSGAQTVLLPLGAEPIRLSAAMLDMRDVRGGNRWTFAVLGLAATLGIGAAITIQLAAEVAEPVAATPVITGPIAAEQSPIVAEPTIPVAPPAEPAPVATPAIEAATPAPLKHAKARSAPVTKRAAEADAMLRVSTYEAVWARVFVGGQQQEVPFAKFKLASGTYTVRLKNTDLGVTRTCTVTLDAGQVRTLKVDMEEGGCDLGR